MAEKSAGFRCCIILLAMKLTGMLAPEREHREHRERCERHAHNFPASGYMSRLSLGRYRVHGSVPWRNDKSGQSGLFPLFPFPFLPVGTG